MPESDDAAEMFGRKPQLFQKQPPQLPRTHGGVEGQIVDANLAAAIHDMSRNFLNDTGFGRIHQLGFQQRDGLLRRLCLRRCERSIGGLGLPKHRSTAAAGRWSRFRAPEQIPAAMAGRNRTPTRRSPGSKPNFRVRDIVPTS